MKLWGGRFDKPTERTVQQFNASLRFDRRLADADIRGSIAWAGALQRAGVLTSAERNAIQEGLERIRSEWGHDGPDPGALDEDIHTAVERRLGEIIGPLAGKLHTGRSRNDQVATDLRLWTMDACARLDEGLHGVQVALLNRARAEPDAPMPGFTHLQPAQPVTWGHWCLWHLWSLQRDRRRFDGVATSTAELPLGAAALAGTGFPVDRERLAQDLGFERVMANSMDAVSDRDFAVEFLAAAALCGVHLSRLSEQLILFANPAFGFISLDDAYATGSSLMPQKKNPDTLELTRGKTGRLIGHLVTLLTVIKGLPSAYDKDLQEDKEPLFDAHDTLAIALPVMAGLIETMTVHPHRMVDALDPAMLATDLADHLVRHGVPFREAHHLAGRAVRAAEERNVTIRDLTEEQLGAIDGRLATARSVLDWEASLAARSAKGGTAPSAIREQLADAERAIASVDGS